METAAPIALIFISLLIGMGMRKLKDFPDNAHIVLNRYLIYIALPALGLLYIPEIEIQAELVFPVASSWIIFLCSVLFVQLMERWCQWSRETTGCLILTAGLGNTAFVGFPVIEALYGAEGIKVALLVVLPGTFVITSTLAVIVGSIYSNENPRKRVLFWQIVTYPPFIAFMAAVAINISGFGLPGILIGVLEHLAATLTPIALISVGLQLSLRKIGLNLKPLLLGLSYKLFLAPFLLLALFVWLFGGRGMEVDVSILQAAMPPMVTGAILATSFGLNPRLAALMVGTGTLLSTVTITLWYLFLLWLR